MLYEEADPSHRALRFKKFKPDLKFREPKKEPPNQIFWNDSRARHIKNKGFSGAKSRQKSFTRPPKVRQHLCCTSALGYRFCLWRIFNPGLKNFRSRLKIWISIEILSPGIYIRRAVLACRKEHSRKIKSTIDRSRCWTPKAALEIIQSLGPLGLKRGGSLASVPEKQFRCFGSWFGSQKNGFETVSSFLVLVRTDSECWKRGLRKEGC